jgi:hypothetical protein
MSELKRTNGQPRIWKRKRKLPSKGQNATEQGLDIAAEALLLRMLDGHVKLRRFPSGQWSVSGIHFISSKVPERLVALRLIEEGPASQKGTTIWSPAILARLVFGKAASAVGEDATDTRNLAIGVAAAAPVSRRAC